MYEICAEFPFDSNRKRMSLIVKFGDEYFLMTKGADSIVLPRINWNGVDGEEKKFTINKELLSFAREGLRTLVIGQKRLSGNEFRSFEAEYQKLKTSTYADKEKKLNLLYDAYEQDLDYVGSTAIEDKLQYGVPETISKIIEAQIKLWVLTGDK